MTYIPDFDLEDMLGVLSSVIEKYAEGSRERNATELAWIALLYVHRIGKGPDFNGFYRRWFDESPLKIEVSHEFATREEADKWLASGKAQHAEPVKIAGKGFLAVQLPGRMTFIDRPLPEELETDEWKDDSNDSE
jgi:hypothetical protein